MIYGIDLGTTNSLIGYGDTLFTDTVSSNVDIENKKQVARDVIGDNIISSYKTNMTIAETGDIPRMCSSIILKTLVNHANIATGNNNEKQDVVISVPAYFSTSQREAVIKAGEMAGLNVRSLINEPTAASLFVCKDYRDLIVVYDLGGGTFDVSIVDSRTGSYVVVATDGIDIGGDDFDNKLVDFVLEKMGIPMRLQNKRLKARLKSACRLTKELMQKLKIDIELLAEEYGGKNNVIITIDDYKRIMQEVFGPTVETLLKVVSSNLSYTEKPKLIFVGGSTSCPFLREMVSEAAGLDIIESDVKPDLIVAKGVALFASMLENGTAREQVQDVTKRLVIRLDDNSCLEMLEENTNIPAANSQIVSNSGTSDKLRLTLYQGSDIMADKNAKIGELVYNFGREVPAGDGLVEVRVEVGYNGVIKIKAKEALFDDAYWQDIELSCR